MSDDSKYVIEFSTGKSVEEIQRAISTLKALRAEMGKLGSETTGKVAAGSKEAAAGLKAQKLESEALTKSTEKAAKAQITLREKIGDTTASMRVNASASAEVERQFRKNIQTLARDKNTILGVAQAQTEVTRLEKIEFQKRAQQRRQNIQDILANESAGRTKELALMKSIMKERFSVQDAANTKQETREKQNLTKNIAYDKQKLASKLETQYQIARLMDKGYHRDQIVASFGTKAVGDARNISRMEQEYAASKRMEQLDKERIRNLRQGTGTIGSNTRAMQNHNNVMRDARGLARGLSGALGQLWMTYGTLAPLMAGAAIGSIARQTYTIGKDVEFRLKMLEALGNRKINIDEMMPAVHGSMKTPLEAAEGLQELAQAGLNAEKSLATLSTTLQIATLGEMSVRDAAFSTASALSTYNLEASEAARVGDVFAKAQSISNATIQSITESMRQAGSAAAIYGITLEDTTAMIALMAQNGIRGSAAGTAVRNAMTELHAPTKKAAGVMSALNIEIYDSSKKSKDYLSVLGEIRGAYYRLNEEGQAAMLKGMFNERSRRFIQIAIKDYDQLKDMLDKVKNSQGFLAKANLDLLDTVEGAANRMKSVLQQSLVQAFDDVGPQIRNTIRSLEQLFASDQFIDGVKSLTSAISTMINVFVQHGDVILKVAGAYAAWRLVIAPLSGAIAGMTRSFMTADGAMKSATGMSTVSTNTRKLASTFGGLAGVSATTSTRILGVVGSVVRFLGPVGLAIGVATTLYTLFKDLGTAANDSANKQSGFQSAIEKNIAALRIQNKELSNSIRLQQLERQGTTPLIEDTNKSTTDQAFVVSKSYRDLMDAERKLKELETKPLGPEDGMYEYVRKANRAKQVEEVRKHAQNLRDVAREENDKLKDTYVELKKTAELNTQAAIESRLSEAKRAYDQLRHRRDANEDKPEIGALVSEVERAQKAMASGAITADEYYDTVMIASEKVDKMMNSFTLPTDEGDKSLKRYTESLSVWMAKQQEETAALNNLTQAYFAGENALFKYNIQSEAGKKVREAEIRTKKDSAAVEAAITKAVYDRVLAEKKRDIGKSYQEQQKTNESAADYIKVLDAQSRGYLEGKKALQEYNNELEIKRILEGVPEDLVKGEAEKLRLQQAQTNQLQDETSARERLNQLIDETDNKQEKYQKTLQRLLADKPYAKTEQQTRALQLAIRELEVENDGFLNATKLGFEELAKSSETMWKGIFEEGKLTMGSISDMFKTMLARMAHEALTKPIIISMQNAVLGTNVSGGVGTGGGNNLLNLLGIGNQAKSGYSAITGGTSQSLGQGINWLGQKLGSETLKSFASGMMNTAGAGFASVGTSAGLAIGSSAAASLGSTLGTSAIANSLGTYSLATGVGTGALAGAGAAAGGAMSAGAMAAAAMPWLAGAGAVYMSITTLNKMFKGETRVGGSFHHERSTNATHFGGGPSGGYGGQPVMSNMNNILKAQSDMLHNAITGIGLQGIEVGATIGSFESSTKGRGGTFSGGTLIIDGQEVRFGKFNKGEGYGGKTGTTEEMFDNMLKDMAYSGLEAFQAIGDRLPSVLRKSFEGLDIRAMTTDQASEALTTIQQIIDATNQTIKALNDLPFKNLTGLSFDLSSSLLEAAGGVESLLSGLSTYYDNFFTEMERGENATKVLQREMEKLGYQLPESRMGFRALIESLDGLNDANHDAIAGLIALSGAASEHYDRIGDSLEKLNNELESDILGTFKTLTSEVQRLFGARNSARQLTDRIGGQINRDPVNAAKREAEIRAQLANATWEQQITLSEELLGLINSRYDLEKERNRTLSDTISEQINALKNMHDLSVSLNDYIKSLQISDLSPNTLRQKVSIAEQELIDLVGKARGGDEKAMGEVQGALESSLRLWREYGASGQDYQDTYDRLTRLAEGLAIDNINSMGPELDRLEKQLETLQETKGISEAQLRELEDLYGITEKATGNIERMYDQMLATLNEEALHLEKIGLNTDQLMEMRDILAALPVDIASHLGPVMDRLTGSMVEGWYQTGFGTGSDQSGLDYWTDRVKNEGLTQPKKEFDNIANQFPNVRKDVNFWYEHFLGRKPDAEGFNFWVNEIMTKGQDRAFTDFMKIVDGSHRSGLDYVPFDGYLAELHKGERVITARDNEIYSRAGGSDNSELLAELRELRRELAQNTNATVEVGNHQAEVAVRTAEQSANLIVSGVGNSIRERSRDDTIRAGSNRRGIL